MRVFLTGATGFIGSRVAPELLAAGHQVLGMTRSDDGARALEAAGVQPHLATLEDPAGVAAGAAQADAVIHTAFDHVFTDFARFVANCEKDARVIGAMADALAGSDRPLIITSGTGLGSTEPGVPAREDVLNLDHPNPRRASEIAGEAARARGVNASVVRLPQVHDEVKQGLITPLKEMAAAKGVVPYVGDGDNRWPAAAVADVARLYVLALEHAEPGACWHAVDEEGVPARDIAEALGAGLGVPVRSISAEEAAQQYGWIGGFLGMDMPASSAITRERLDWRPTGPSLLDDLRRMDFAAG